ncbi:MAG TPA: DMT family transporter [Candidatus Poseidoniales archaeon]|jgi:drug/metabolite transporter (DMT)-like permease|nr:MAG: hypothetical protein CXT69_02405 [Euryarchaeota archaeon]HIG04094.1 DMT family transporter [Candidatus Poseidoniales archaeon]HIK78677.1 DMT family transporter [Candidatus Poseidoniales archaeon]
MTGSTKLNVANQQQGSATWIIHLKLLFVAVAWGLGWTAGRVMALNMPPVSAAWLRYIIAIPCLMAWMVYLEGWRVPTKQEWRKIILIGILSTFLYQTFFMYGMKWTAAGDASLVIAFNPLFTALLAIPLLGNKITNRLGWGLLLGVGGILVIFTQSPNVNIPANERILGDTLIAIAALVWAFASIQIKKAMNNPTSDSIKPLTPLAITVWASIVGLAFLTPWAGVETYQHGIPIIDIYTWAAIVFLAIGSTVISYVWFAQGIKELGESYAALYVYLVPPFGIISGWVLLDEKLGWSLLIALMLIIGGVALAQSEAKQEPSQTITENL